MDGIEPARSTALREPRIPSSVSQDYHSSSYQSSPPLNAPPDTDALGRPRVIASSTLRQPINSFSTHGTLGKRSKGNGSDGTPDSKADPLTVLAYAGWMVDRESHEAG
ncbi:MAG: hypothetical protein Q9219_000046 [cf. Caloplaca sp. 3 TL-2023]